MQSEGLVQMTYWGGWASAGLAVLYKLLYVVGVADVWGAQVSVYPHHLWQLSFLLFLITIASDVCARRKGA